MRDVLFLVVPWIVRIAASYLVVWLDERRMSEELRERAWPPSSRLSALFGFDVLAVLVHFVKTRWRPLWAIHRLAWGLLLGLLAAGAVLGLSVGAVILLALALGEPLD
ncbi:MAG: hypothetical protein JNL38_33765 [Myxococcales bacterium]|nr:hypothetical protein [Myxococcales bacterium]